MRSRANHSVNEKQGGVLEPLPPAPALGNVPENESLMPNDHSRIENAEQERSPRHRGLLKY